MSKDLITWAAGFIDGEGTVTFGKSYKKDLILDAFPLIRVVQADKNNLTIAPSLVILKDIFGGYIGRYKSKHPKRRNHSAWVISHKASTNCIKKLLPYLIEKREQAEILITYQDIINDHSWRNRTKVPTEEMKRRLKIVAKNRKLNKRIKIDIKCQTCEKEFKSAPSLRQRLRTFCSKKCFYDDYKKNPPRLQEEEIKQRRKLVEEIRILNKRGL